MTEKPKTKPMNYRNLSMRIMRLAILLAAFPLWLTAAYLANAYQRPGIFLFLFLSLITWLTVLGVSLINDSTPIVLIVYIAKSLWKITDTNEQPAGDGNRNQ